MEPIMLPTPSLSFTLPSIHDEARLDCRIYHPACLNDPALSSSSSSKVLTWRKQAAIVAHPYAPMGGCFDDPIVHLVATTVLQLGFVTATFNFRGASSLGGRTSWTSRPERADYMSVAGFLAYYLHYLDSPQPPPTRVDEKRPLPTMLLAGYSYGAMITTKLPPLDKILVPFASPAVHTAAADIRLRAQHLAEQQNKISATPASPRKSLGMRVGGDEDSPRKSHDRIHSVDREDKIRKGVKDLLARTKLIRKGQRRSSPNLNLKFNQNQIQNQQETEHYEVQYLEKVLGFVAFQSAYLMVSPPFGTVTSLATMTFSNPFSSWSRRSSKNTPPSPAKEHSGTEAEREQAAADEKLVMSPSLAIYGDSDGFLTLRKMRDWTRQLSSVEGSQFRWVEVAGAGHFWVEEGVARELRDAVGAFVTGLVGDLC